MYTVALHLGILTELFPMYPGISQKYTRGDTMYLKVPGIERVRRPNEPETGGGVSSYGKHTGY